MQGSRLHRNSLCPDPREVGGCLQPNPPPPRWALSWGTAGTEAGAGTFQNRAIASSLCTRWPQV